MIILRLLLGVLYIAGLDASTTVQTTQASSNAATSQTSLTAAAAATTATTATIATTATTPAPTTAANTISTAILGTKTTHTATGSIASTVPTINTPTNRASSTLQTKAVTVLSTPQQSPQTAAAATTKANTPGQGTTTQPSVTKGITTLFTKTDQSTTQTTNVPGPGDKQSTVALLAHTVANVTTSPTASGTSQQSKATDAANTTHIYTPALTSTLALHPRTIPSTTTSKNPADSSNYNLTPTALTADIKSSDFLGVYNYTDRITIKCQSKTENSGQLVKINMKASKICPNTSGKPAKNEEEEEEEKKSFMYLCKALKPGYNPIKDSCIIVLVNLDPDQLAIVDAYVENHLDPSELYEQLKTIKKKDNNSLFSYDNIKDNDEDLVSIPLISAIVSLAVVLLIIAAVYGCWHQKQTWKREQRLTEELQTMENGYHDNPTLEVMETSPEMQEKKGGPNGELGDSWIVPLDNLTREDLDEEDTHL